MRRREFIKAIAGLAAMWPLAAQAQQPVPRIGILSPASSKSTAIFDAFIARLHELGYIEGRSIVLDFYLAAGAPDRVPVLAADLLRQKVDVLVADGVNAIGAVQRLTKTIPTVGVSGVDPVASGFAASLAKPGGNFTGVTTFAIELHGKRLALLKEAIPEATSFAVLIDGSQDPGGLVLPSMRQTARRLGVRLDQLEQPHDAEDLPAALRLEALTKFDGIVVGSGPMFWNSRVRIVALVAESRRPAIYPEREYADAGGLISYGPNVPDAFRRLAELVDRILKGASPAEIPIEQVSRVDFIINLGTAAKLGITISPALVARANDVIE
jgi:putative tryptophan/tyrosine transport system substrate-binding protein